MGWLQELFRVHQNLDTIERDELERLYTESERLNVNLAHARTLLNKIIELKKEGKPISHALRENLGRTLDAIKREILTELQLEEELKTIEGEAEKQASKLVSEFGRNVSSKMKCPRCSSQNIKHDPRSGPWYDCLDCKHHFQYNVGPQCPKCKSQDTSQDVYTSSKLGQGWYTCNNCKNDFRH